MRVDHLGIAVRELSRAVPAWEQMTAGHASAPEDVASQKVRVSFLEVGSTHLEFLEPTDPTSSVGRFLESRGEGFHHVAFEVPNVDETLRTLGARGTRLIDQVGRPGARGRRVGFVHPSANNGVLVEFIEGP